MKARFILTGLLGIIALGGCSVKEDRTACPLWLSVDMSALQPHSTTAWAVIRHPGGLLSEEVIFKNGQTVFEWPILKGETAASAYCGFNERHLKGHQMIVPTGETAPALRGSVHHESTYGETLNIAARDSRQSARMNLEAVVPDGSPYPYGLLLEGDICGLDLLSLAPIEGEFGHRVHLNEENRASFHILRQSETSSLILHILDKGKIIESIPLGEWIRKTGYDWEAEDLMDINMSFEQGHVELTIIISDWQHPDGEDETYEFIF